jgi:serine/threonine protein kinase
MAPELFAMDDDESSRRPALHSYNAYAADIYSLGATLYMLVVGEPPYMADNQLELARLICEAEEVPFPAYGGRAARTTCHCQLASVSMSLETARVFACVSMLQ